jgi:hypothetical protein
LLGQFFDREERGGMFFVSKRLLTFNRLHSVTFWRIEFLILFIVSVQGKTNLKQKEVDALI